MHVPTATLDTTTDRAGDPSFADVYPTATGTA